MPAASKRTLRRYSAGAASLFARVFGKVSRVFQSIAIRMAADDLQASLVIGSTRYDMVGAPDEPYYAAQYWAMIGPALRSFPERSICLDLGCSQGRFSYMLAERFPDGHVIACDLSPSAINAAIVGAEVRGIDNIEFHCRSIAEQLSLCQESGFDVIVMTEVTIFYPEWTATMPSMVRLLRPNGVLVMSFRSQYFNGLCLARNKRLDSIDMLLQQRRGRIFSPSLTEFSWQTSADIRSLFEESGLELCVLQGIGACSGIPGDPHDHIARPSMLAEVEKDKLMILELELGRSVPDAGRYILAIGRKQ